MKKKYKILMLSDHALSTSGVGCQSRYLINGLVEKGRWSVRQFGAAIKHTDYNVLQVNPDFIIKPIDGFGNRETIIQTLVTEKPDLLLIFTDPRFFLWLYEIEDEIRQVCPIAYWHVWDNYPYPEFNDSIYQATDLINCHSHMTYTMIKEKYPEKTNFIPHALPEDVFYPLEKEEIDNSRRQLLGPGSEDKFVLFWVNRNARRKRPSDLLWAWSRFVDRLDENEKKNVVLLLHTDPKDQEGPDLIRVAENMNILDSCFFSTQRIDFEKMNVLHNISDACINISYAEGFGLATLEAMQCSKPIIAVKTGGLTRQVVDHRDGSENGIALDVDTQTLVGSQVVPYIFEDYANVDKVTDAIYDMYKKTPNQRKELGQKARNYALSEFSLQKTVDLWDESLHNLIQDYRTNDPRRWTFEELNEAKQ